jgi:hypothetical protein
MPANFLSSRTRRKGTQHSDFDQSAREGIRLSTKFCAIGTRAWIGAARRAREHPALDADREQRILDWIQQKAKQSTPVGKTEIKDEETTQLKVSITRS